MGKLHKPLAVLLTILLIAFTFATIKEVRDNEEQIRLQEVQIQDTRQEKEKLELEYFELEETKTKELREKEAEIERLQQREVELQRQITQRRLLKEQQARVAAAQSQKTVRSPQKAPQANHGAGCEWLKGQLLANGVAQNDIAPAIAIASKESSCRQAAVNKSSGACNVFQEYNCGKWGGRNNLAAHIRGADSYAKNRYGGWHKAYQKWLVQKWW